MRRRNKTTTVRYSMEYWSEAGAGERVTMGKGQHDGSRCPSCGEKLVVLSRTGEYLCPRGHELPMRKYTATMRLPPHDVVEQKTAAQIIREWNAID